MKKIAFYKMQASGNDFVLIEAIAKLKGRFYSKLAKVICQRKLSLGADGLLVIESSKQADFKMRIFNSDGSEAEMCGNGARCAAFWAKTRLGRKKTDIVLETKAGIVESEAKDFKQEGPLGDSAEVGIKVMNPYGFKQNLTLKVFGRQLKVNFINTGVPHTVVFVSDLDNIDIEDIGREIRFHRQFAPAGTNVDFVEILDKNFIKVRTYERGVEAETLACGTGSIASAIVSDFKLEPANIKKTSSVKVQVKSKEILRVYFNRHNKNIDDVWLEGRANLVYRGEISI